MELLELCTGTAGSSTQSFQNSSLCWNRARKLPEVLQDPFGHHHYTPTLYLGKGSYARCYSALDSSTCSQVALKIVAKNRLIKKSQMENMRKEITIHESLEHRNIVRFLRHFEDEVNVYMVLELCSNGTLLSRIQNAPERRLKDYNARVYLLQIIDAVTYLHEQIGILHRDLKPGNILLSADDEVKLADFGLAVKLDELPKTLWSVCGTPNYLSPQVIMLEGYSKESEAWSIGCILYCMLVGKPPFETDSLEETYRKIATCDFSFPQKLELCIFAEDLISKLLILDANERLKVADIKFHPYLYRCKTTGQRELYNNSLPLRRAEVLVEISQQRNLKESSFGDSGIDAEGYLNVMPRSTVDCKTLYKQLLRGLYSVSDELPHVADLQVNMVSKWVDYTNKYGFGCVLRDGTHSILFVDNSAFSYRQGNGTVSERYLMISDVEQDPWIVSEWTASDLPSNQQFTNKVRVAKHFSDYMDKELQSVFKQITFRQHLDSLVYQKRHNGILLMFLAMGTIQMNFLETHEKLVISRDEHDRLLLTAIDPYAAFCNYQLIIGAASPTRPECQKVQHLLRKACKLVEDENSFLPRTYCATEC